VVGGACMCVLLQVLEHGCFNCDPHPGNLMLMPDGRLALIDFGQVCLWSSVCLWSGVCCPPCYLSRAYNKPA
jgi:hypothetical protein